MSNTVLSTHKVSVQVAEKTLLHEVSFAVEKGRHLALIGANGAGKSTLMRVLLGITSSSCKVIGTVALLGRDLRTLSRKEIASSVAYVPQLLEMEVPYTVREFITMGRYVFSSKSTEVVDRVMQVVGVTEFAERSVSTLSGGERQRVCIAAALAQEAPIILLDEPLAHLDPGQRIEVQRTLRKVGEMATLIVVTHDIHWVKRDFTHVVALKDGRLVFDGNHHELVRKEVMRDLFGVDLTEEGRDV